MQKVVNEGSLAEIRALVAQGADPQVRDIAGHNLIFDAAQRCDSEGLRLCRYFLEECSLSPQDPDQTHQTPLFFAARCGNFDVAKLLLDSKVNVNHKDRNVQTPLFYAARYSHVPCVCLMLERQAEPNTKDLSLQTPLICAAVYQSSSSVVEALCVIRCDAGIYDDKGRTALFYANDAQSCLHLLKHKCRPDTRDFSHQSALFVAVKNGQTAKAQLLLEWRADVDLRDKNKETPLFSAIDGDRVDTCRVLLAARADPLRRNKQQKSALDVALSHRDEPRPPAIVNLIREVYVKAQQEKAVLERLRTVVRRDLAMTRDEIDDLVLVARLSGKGRCLLTRVSMEKGSVIIREAPIMQVHPAKPGSDGRVAWMDLQSMHVKTPFAFDPMYYYAAYCTMQASEAAFGKISNLHRPSETQLVHEPDIVRILSPNDLRFHKNDFEAVLLSWRYNAYNCGDSGLALYETGCLMAHASKPTAEFEVTKDGVLVLRALQSLEEFTEITIQYVQPSSTSGARLREWGISCDCGQCTCGTSSNKRRK